MTPDSFAQHFLTRRGFLDRLGTGLAGIALQSLFARESRAADHGWKPPTGLPFFPPKAKRVIWLTMAGGPGGEDVVARLREIDPAVKAIVSSGYATDENAEHYRKLGFSGILSKPYRSGDLGRVLKEVLGPPK